MRKVKIIKSSHHVDYYGDDHNSLYPMAGDWEEVSDNEYYEMQDAVRYANNKAKNGYYFLVEYYDDLKDEVFKSASEFKEKMLKQKEREEKAREEAKKKREEKAQERKRKQLEKLKKELGED